MSAIVAVVGLGYVGLPLAVAFGKQFETIGYDVSRRRIDELIRRVDRTGAVPEHEFRQAVRIAFTNDARALAGADFVVVAVPTPVDRARQPDLRALRSASRTVGTNMKRGAIIVYESTVYPGATAHICVPELEAASGMKWKRDFFVGYSPERINPGDRDHTLEKITKVVSGDVADTVDKLASLYGAVVKAGIHRAPSIEIAEAAKVIENTQRDLNIALMNELAVIFDRLGLDTREVLEAAATKWNFLRFSPGLVGGHCIGVDPYYLTHRAEMEGYHPEVILAGRRINDGMAKFVAEKTIRMLAHAGKAIRGSKVNVLGITFKEDVADLRNSKVADLCSELAAYGIEVHVHDPLADHDDAQTEYGITLESWNELPKADALILAVPHRQFRLTTHDVVEKLSAGGCVIDIKAALDLSALRAAGLTCWRV